MTETIACDKNKIIWEHVLGQTVLLSCFAAGSYAIIVGNDNSWLDIRDFVVAAVAIWHIYCDEKETHPLVL